MKSLINAGAASAGMVVKWDASHPNTPGILFLSVLRRSGRKYLGKNKAPYAERCAGLFYFGSHGILLVFLVKALGEFLLFPTYN